MPAALRGKRVGLITNNTGIDRSGTSDIDLIAASDDLTLVAPLAPEHGIRGTAEAGVTVGDGVDAKTGVPVYSLYGAQGHDQRRSPRAAAVRVGPGGRPVPRKPGGVPGVQLNRDIVCRSRLSPPRWSPIGKTGCRRWPSGPDSTVEGCPPADRSSRGRP